MNTNNNDEKPFTFRFIDTKPRVLLELQNTTEKTFRSIEILTVFLNDEDTPDGGPSQAHIRFDTIKSIHQKDSAVLSHRTWINGKQANDERDQMARLKIIAREANPHGVDNSWMNAESRARFQR